MQLATALVAICAFNSCGKDPASKPSEPVAKEINAPSLIAPSFGYSINVKQTDGVTFKWSWSGEGTPSFELMIDRKDGDFSSPLASFATESRNHAVSAAELEALYEANRGTADEVSLSWTVRASLDGSNAEAKSRSFTLKSVESAPVVQHGPSYTNPVNWEIPMPDPDVIRGDDGWFYCYGTEATAFTKSVNVPIYKSKDLVSWQYVGHVFTEHPALTTAEKNVWAPSINKVGDKYVLYFSQPGTENGKHRTGVAVADTPAGPFKNLGVILDPTEQGVEFCIDAYLYQEDDRNYLLWGSHRPISIIELTADATEIKDKETQKRSTIAGSGQYLYEGTVLHKRNDYYYLICSCGNYVKNGTYKLVCARSKSILGPYVNKAGEKMKDGQHEFILIGDSEALPDGTPEMSTTDRYFTSPGHCSKIITDDSGVDWILYHSRVAENNNNNRYLMLDRIEWSEDGWPYVPGLRPSRTAEFGPYFK